MAELHAAGWDHPPPSTSSDPPLPATDVALAIAADYAGEPYEPGLETDEAYLDPALSPPTHPAPVDGTALLPDGPRPDG